MHLVARVCWQPGLQPDFTIRSSNQRGERDVQRNINPTQFSEQSIGQLRKTAVPVKETDADFAPRQIELNVNVTAAIREQAERNRTALKVDGLITESYRFIDPAHSLKCL